MTWQEFCLKIMFLYEKYWEIFQCCKTFHPLLKIIIESLHQSDIHFSYVQPCKSHVMTTQCHVIWKDGCVMNETTGHFFLIFAEICGDDTTFTDCNCVQC